MFMRKAFFVVAAIAVANEFKADAVLLKLPNNDPPVNPTLQPVRGDEVERALDEVDSEASTVEDSDLRSPEAAGGETAIDISDVKGDEVTDVPRRKAGLCARAQNFVAEHKFLSFMLMSAAAFMIVYFLFFGPDPTPTPTTTSAPTPDSMTSTPNDPLNIEAITTDVLARLPEGLKKFNDFYTEENFVKTVGSLLAVGKEAWRSTAEVQTHLGALIANYRKETGDGASCKEIIKLTSANAYTTERSPSAGFSTHKCNNQDAPTNGCKGPEGQDFSGEDAKKCFYGRGGFQLSWPGNYNDMQTWLSESGVQVDLCNNPDAVCEDPRLAMQTMILFWANKVKSNSVSAKQFCDASGICDFSRSINGIGPENNAGNQGRVQYFTDILDTLGLTYQRKVMGSLRGGVQFDQVIVDTNQDSVGPVAPVSTAAPAASTAAPTGSTCYDDVKYCTKNSDCEGEATPFKVVRTDRVPNGCSCGSNWTSANAAQIRCGQPPEASPAPACNMAAATPEYCQCRYGDESLQAFGDNGHGNCGCGKNWTDANSHPERTC